MKTMKTAAMLLLAGAALALSGCASGGSDEPANPPATNSTSQAECEGVWAQVAVEGESDATCVDTDTSITALGAFEKAGFELEGVKTSDAFFACRIDGFPASDKELEFEGESYSPDCADFGPEWAWWGLFVDTGAGWDFAMEGAETQLLEPGQAVAFVWQFGDTSEPVLPESSD